MIKIKFCSICNEPSTNLQLHRLLPNNFCEKCMEMKELQLITLSRAMNEYNLTKNNLLDLPYLRLQNPHYRCASPMYLYLLGDVKKLSTELMIQDKLNKQKILDEKISKLKKKGIDIKNLSLEKNLYNYAIGDYLNCNLKKPKTNLIKVVKQFKAVIRINNESPIKNTSIIPYYVNFSHLDNKEIIKRAIDFKNLFNNTMNIVIKEVETYLNIYEIDNLYSTYSNYHFSSMLMTTDMKNKEIKKLKNLLEKTDLDNFKHDINYASRNPTHQLCGLEALYNKIQKLKSNKQTYHERKQIIIDNFKPYRLHLREDSTLCKAYMEKKTICEIEEVVAIIRLVKFLFSKSHIFYSLYHEDMTNKLRDNFYLKSMSWSDAYQNVILHFFK